MRLRFAIVAALLAAVSLPAASTNARTLKEALATRTRVPLPSQLGREAREQYRAVFADIHAGRWADAAAKLDAMGDGLLHPIARAELLTAAGTPKAELPDLMAVLVVAPELPQAPQIAVLAERRGATTLPALPREQKMVWLGSSPVRARAKPTRSDAVAAELDAKATPYIETNEPRSAEAELEAVEAQLSPEALTEWRQRVAWSYYISGDDANARRLAARAAASDGDWAVQAAWVAGLAAWRQHDCRAAAGAFQQVALKGGDTETRAAGSYWASRADLACGHPERVQAALRAAARNPETFYGMLASEALGLAPKHGSPDGLIVDWERISRVRNVRVAVALVEIDEDGLAAEVLRHQAEIGAPRDHEVLLRVAARLDLPEAQIWLAHNGPAGAQVQLAAERYPTPSWTPEHGWRVDPALVFAHTLQESRFRRDVVSPAGAKGLMQVRPGTAGDIARARGEPFTAASLSQPAMNLEFGQTFLEGLRDSSATKGLLPKVIAAYNAGPVPIERWNTSIKGGGDPLLYIESIPYWETRGYVPIVLRNYWMYEQKEGRRSVSRKALAQGLWPRFPTAGRSASADEDDSVRLADAD